MLFDEFVEDVTDLSQQIAITKTTEIRLVGRRDDRGGAGQLIRRWRRDRLIETESAVSLDHRDDDPDVFGLSDPRVTHAALLAPKKLESFSVANENALGQLRVASNLGDVLVGRSTVARVS